jgi:hypothetical protein
VQAGNVYRPGREGSGVPEIYQKLRYAQPHPALGHSLQSASDLGGLCGHVGVLHGVMNHPRIDDKDGIAAFT